MIEFKEIVTKRDMRTFLGAIGYFRCFIPRCAEYTAFLSPATSKQAPGLVLWTEDMFEAFSHLKGVLCNLCILTIPTISEGFALHTNASRMGIGEVWNVCRYEQIVGGLLCPSVERARKALLSYRTRSASSGGSIRAFWTPSLGQTLQIDH